jgi:hypothetical protein
MTPNYLLAALWIVFCGVCVVLFGFAVMWWIWRKYPETPAEPPAFESLKPSVGIIDNTCPVEINHTANER